jgi:hypothetical protein
VGYLTPAGVSIALDVLLNQFPDVCTRLNLGSTDGTYTVGQTVDFPVVPKETFVGCSDDWTFSRQFTDPTFAEVFAFTIEADKRKRFAGDENDGGFFPRFDTHLSEGEAGDSCRLVRTAYQRGVVTNVVSIGIGLG